MGIRTLGRAKPRPSIIDPTRVDPTFQWFWDVDSPPFLLPFWSRRLDEPDVFHGLKPTLAGSGFSYEPGNIRGGTLKSTGDSRLRYATGDHLGTIANFNKDEKWTVFCGIQIDDTSADQCTVFGKSPNGGTANDRQLFIRTNKKAAPTEFLVESAGALKITGTTSIQEGVPYLCALTNDGTANAGGMALYSAELFTGVVIDDGATGQFTAAKVASTELHLGAHFSDTNDPLIGELSFFYYLPSIQCTREQIFQLARKPFGPLRMAPRHVGFVSAAPPGGRIMSSLARHGGLAGYGGIAGKGGGLAA